jgi:hypothetical protein
MRHSTLPSLNQTNTVPCTRGVDAAAPPSRQPNAPTLPGSEAQHKRARGGGRNSVPWGWSIAPLPPAGPANHACMLPPSLAPGKANGEAARAATARRSTWPRTQLVPRGSWLPKTPILSSPITSRRRDAVRSALPHIRISSPARRHDIYSPRMMPSAARRPPVHD